jgi:catechol 2,3-dioxygenase-like lactoylglutathione lyase family enzyme
MHLRALSLSTGDPTAAADLYAALGARIGGTPRGDDTLVIAGGTMLTCRRRDDAAPTRTVLGFIVPDMAVVGERLTAAGIDWTCETPGVIGFRDSDGNPCYVIESGQRDGLSLIAATLFVRDPAESIAWWAAAGLPPGRAKTPLGYRVPAAALHDGDAAVFLDGALTLHLVDGPVTTAMRLRVHVAAPALDAAEAGLTALGSPVERSEAELRTVTLEGCEVALVVRG